jgi:hypothetical protein
MAHSLVTELWSVLTQIALRLSVRSTAWPWPCPGRSVWFSPPSVRAEYVRQDVCLIALVGEEIDPLLTTRCA